MIVGEMHARFAAVGISVDIRCTNVEQTWQANIVVALAGIDSRRGRMMDSFVAVVELELFLLCSREWFVPSSEVLAVL